MNEILQLISACDRVPVLTVNSCTNVPTNFLLIGSRMEYRHQNIIICTWRCTDVHVLQHLHLQIAVVLVPQRVRCFANQLQFGWTMNPHGKYTMNLCCSWNKNEKNILFWIQLEMEMQLTCLAGNECATIRCHKDVFGGEFRPFKKHEFTLFQWIVFQSKRFQLGWCFGCGNCIHIDPNGFKLHADKI